jgi:hypothetical protein
MTFSSALASVFMGGLILHAAIVNSPATESVKVCLTGDYEHFIAARAESLTTGIFAEIGIHLEWFHDSRHCKTPPQDFLNVLLSNDPADHESPGALAYSRLHDNPHIEVFYNRVVATVEPARVPRLLANVLAHEIAHMLEGTGRHAEAGIMKAHWNHSDVLQLSEQPLSFTPADASMIQHGLAQRSAP